MKGSCELLLYTYLVIEDFHLKLVFIIIGCNERDWETNLSRIKYLLDLYRHLTKCISIGINVIILVM